MTYTVARIKPKKNDQTYKGWLVNKLAEILTNKIRLIPIPKTRVIKKFPFKLSQNDLNPLFLSFVIKLKFRPLMVEINSS